METTGSKPTDTFLSRHFLVISPILVLIITKIIIEFCIRNFQPNLSWIPSFVGYYLTISLMLFIAAKYKKIPLRQIFTLSFKPIPKIGWILAGVIFPAFLVQDTYGYNYNSYFNIYNGCDVDVVLSKEQKHHLPDNISFFC